MSLDLLTTIPGGHWLFVCLVAIGAGFIKGNVGFGMPMILVSGLGSVFQPELALAAMILPTLATNLWQSLRQGVAPAIAAMRTHWLYLAVILVVIALAAQTVTWFTDRQLYLILGIPVVCFAAVQLAGWRPQVTPANRRKVEIGTASVAGITGGLSGIWGPPTVLYLVALQTPKAESMRLQGIVYGAGAVVLCLAHLRSGILDGETLPVSAAVILPAILGMYLGFRAGDRLDQRLFTRLTLIVLILAGLNLVRRGIT